MNAELITQLESYTKTQNQHWNKFTFQLLCVAITEKAFENPGLPLELFSTAFEIFSHHHNSPLKAVWLFDNEMEQKSLTAGQKLFMYEWTCKYLHQSEFDVDLEPIYSLLKSGKSKLKVDKQSNNALVKNIRDTLKEVVHQELADLPDTLKGLEPTQRLNILCKLMPFVLPKVDSIDCEKGEFRESSFTDFIF